jgi:suppressor for copper-sensitivity B
MGDGKVAARLITATDAVGTGGILEAGIEFRLAPGWHVYWRTPGDAGLPPTADWAGSANVSSPMIAWPFPARLIIDGLQNNVYSGPVVLPVTVRLLHPGQPTRLQAQLRYAACAEVCVPYEADISLSLPPGLASPGLEAPAIAAARARVPGSLADVGIEVAAFCLDREASPPRLDLTLHSRAVPFVAPDLFVEGIGAAIPDAYLQADPHVVRFRVALNPGGSRDLRLTVADQGRATEFGAMAADCTSAGSTVTPGATTQPDGPTPNGTP